jgi:hypothetical protein
MGLGTTIKDVIFCKGVFKKKITGTKIQIAHIWLPRYLKQGKSIILHIQTQSF